MSNEMEKSTDANQPVENSDPQVQLMSKCLRLLLKNRFFSLSGSQKRLHQVNNASSVSTSYQIEWLLSMLLCEFHQFVGLV